MSEQLQVSDILFDPEKDEDLTAEYIRFRELTKELSTRPEDIRMGSADFAKVVFFLDHYSRMNLWSEFFPIPPEAGDPKKQWRTIGESLVGKEPLDSQEKQKMDPSRFASTLQELVSMEPTKLQERLVTIRENQKMDPTALFASQYAEAIKLRREVDPVLGLYETLKSSYAQNDFATFNQTVLELRKVGTKRAGDEASTLGFEKTYNGFEPFYRSMMVYVLVFIVAASSWLVAACSSIFEKAEKFSLSPQESSFCFNSTCYDFPHFWITGQNVYRRSTTSDQSLFIGPVYWLGRRSALFPNGKIPAFRRSFGHGFAHWLR